ncbi:MAG: efflux RND transporter periplasmic adaptor subunit [Siphonobacter sp.]
MKSTSVLVLIVIATVFGLMGCQSKANETAESGEEESFELTPALMKQIKIDTAQLRTVNNEITLTGKVTFNQEQVVKVFPLVSGHINKVRVELGDHVNQGQVLAELSSGDLADLEQQALTARSQLAIARKNVQVMEDMAKGGLATQKELLAAREELTDAEGEVARVSERRKIVGGNGSTYIIKAPVSGFVVEKNAATGMELRSDDPQQLFTIGNLNQVWILANVYETDLASVKKGYTANITTLAYPGKVFKGKIDKIFNTLDPQSKTEQVRIILPNGDLLLKPEMFANVSVEYAGTEKRIAIPAQAVIFDNSQNYVVVYKDEKHLEVRPVTVYRTIGNTSYIDGGLQAGERLITRNQLLVYNALNQ